MEGGVVGPVGAKGSPETCTRTIQVLQPHRVLAFLVLAQRVSQEK